MREIIEKLCIDIFQMESDLSIEYDKLEGLINDNTDCIGRMVLDDWTKFCLEELCHLKRKRITLCNLKFKLLDLIIQYHYENYFIIHVNPEEKKTLVLPKRLMLEEVNNVIIE